jgi:2-haloalkanoic acid dehalogenase type II
MTDRPFVVFDLGETLVDLRTLVADLSGLLQKEFGLTRLEANGLAVGWIRQSWLEMPRAAGSPFRSEFDVASDVLSRALTSRGIETDRNRAGVLLRRAWDIFETHVSFCPGVSIDWLKQIGSRSAGLGIITDGDDENVSRLVRRLGLAPYFDCIVTSESVRAYKPDPRIYREALRALKAQPTQALFVSDTLLDVQGAVAVGMPAALLPRGSENAPSQPDSGIVVLANPGQLATVIERYTTTGRFGPAEVGL